MWVKIDDAMPENRKVLAVSVAIRWAYIESICYCARNLTDGVIPVGFAKRLTGPVGIRTLLDAGLWEQDPGGYVVHDYLMYNPTREEVLAERAATADQRARDAVAGGRARAASARRVGGRFAPAETPAPSPADAVPLVFPLASVNQPHQPPVPVPDPVPLRDPPAAAPARARVRTSRAVDQPPNSDAEAVYRALYTIRTACIDGDVPLRVDLTLRDWASILTPADVRGIEGEIDGRHRWNLAATIIGSWAADRKRGDDPAAVRAADRARVTGGGANGRTPGSRGVAPRRTGRFTTAEQEAAEYGPGTVGHF